MSSSRKAVQRQAEVSPSTPAPSPLLVDIRTAASLLGISVFAVRNLCWHRETKHILKPVRQGLKFLFSPIAVADFATKLVAGEIQFPATPTKSRKRAA
jgi:hypothetical protein